MAVLIAFLLGENSPFVGGPFHVADTVDHEFCYKSRHTGSLRREGLEASFAHFLPSRREYAGDQAV